MLVHELAKELGLKSHELLERIQKEGLDVKVSALASLRACSGPSGTQTGSMPNGSCTADARRGSGPLAQAHDLGLIEELNER